MKPTKEQIAKKRGYNLLTCTKCGEDVYYKYKVAKPLCESCKVEKHTKQSRDLNRKYRAKELLEKSPNKFKTKYIAAKLHEIMNELALSNKEIKGILKYFVDTLYENKIQKPKEEE